MPRLRLSFADIVATMLPGAVWLLLLISLFDGCRILLTSNKLPDGWTPISPLAQLWRESNDLHWAQASFLVIGGLLIGRFLKIVGMEVAERLSRPDYLMARVRYGHEYARKLLFPYPYRHEKSRCLARINRYCEDAFGVSPNDLPSTQPIVFCYRLINLRSPELWAMVSMRESESRLAGSLYLASLVNLAFSIVFAVTAWPSKPLIAWMAASVLFATALFHAVRRARRREVDYMYIDALLCTGKQGKVDGRATEHDRDDVD